VISRSGYEKRRRLPTAAGGFCRPAIAISLVFLTTVLVAQTRETAPIGKYNGPGGCAASSCHGSVLPKTVLRIPQNEYSIWVGQDKHARAYQVLSNDVSVRMGKILGLKSPPEQNPKCLACHALAVKPEERAQTFDISDGVSCENCHGPASGWLGPHTVRGWETESGDEKGKLGMIDLRDMAVRAHNCLHCHVGTEEKWVDHEMIAAGHPDLTFELNLFSAVMPRHWRDPNGAQWLGTKEWAVGQAMQLRDSLRRLARRSRSSTWPEYAELDCFACHHSLTAPSDSWRQETGYTGRTPGVPAWNSARFVVFRYAAKETDAAAAARLETEIASLGGLMGQLSGNRDQIATSADRAAEIVHQLATELDSRSYDQAFTLQIMQKIAADSRTISQQGQRSAEQATMSLDSLYNVCKQNGVANDEVKSAIAGLFVQVQNPSAYNAPAFEAQLQKVSTALRK
jgi:hypothetical protein